MMETKTVEMDAALPANRKYAEMVDRILGSNAMMGTLPMVTDVQKNVKSNNVAILSFKLERIVMTVTKRTVMDATAIVNLKTVVILKPKDKSNVMTVIQM